MKQTSGFLELVIIILFMTGSLSLFSTLLYTMNSSTTTYMEDKTSLTSKNGIDYEVSYVEGIPTIVPSYMGRFKISYESMLLSFLIFDDYAPDTNKVAVKRNDGTVSDPIDFTLKENRVNKFDYISEWYNLNSSGYPKLAEYKNDTSPWYLYWVSETSNWLYSREYKSLYK